MNKFSWPEGPAGTLWFIFLSGVSVGLLLGRITMRGPAGDWLTALALVVLGLASGVVLLNIGWQMGRRAHPSAERERTTGAAQTAEGIARAREELGYSEEARGATEGEIASKVVSTEMSASSVPARAVEPRVTRLGEHFSLVRTGDKWIGRAHNVLGYESLQFAIGLNRAWSTRLTTHEGRQEAAHQFSLSFGRTETIGLILFLVALGIYAITRFVRLDEFPIYFFTDEAIGPVLGTELVKRGFRDGAGNLFPTYFQNGLYWNLSLSVYVHALTATLFGKSILVTRATSALFSLCGAAAVGLILKWFFKLKTWWLGVLLLAVTPAWFLHSRTAFETVMMVSLYSIFLLFYLLYRYRSPNYLYPTLIFAAATFYSYANGQPLIGLSGLLFLISDFRYHLKNWRTGVWGIALLALLALPYLRFRMQHPDIVEYHLRILDSYWLQPLSLQTKIDRFVSTYLYGLSPQYWFVPNDQDLIRHQMKDYGNISLWVLPFFVVGLAVALRKFKMSESRAVLIALLVAPFGSALADIAVTRALLFVVPAAILAALGVDALISWLKQPRAHAVAMSAAFVIPALLSLTMLNDALTNGPTWYDNYGLYGMQWGAKQLFQEVLPQLVEDNPDVPIYVTHSWANGTDVFLRFFDLDHTQIQMITVDAWITKKLPLNPDAIFIMAPEEYQKVQSNPKFKSVTIDSTVQYPDGRDGFYIGRLEYADNVDEIFAAEREALRQLVTEPVTIDGEVVELSHTKFDIGQAKDMFDGDPYTVARGVEANPLVLDFKFSKPRALHGLSAYLGKANMKVTAKLYTSDSAQPVEYSATFNYALVSSEFPAGPLAEMSFDGAPASVTRLRLEIQYPGNDETAHVHVFDLKFR